MKVTRRICLFFEESRRARQKGRFRLEGKHSLTSYLRTFCVLVCLASFESYGFSQRITVDPYNSYHRVYAIVPVVGAGSSADPVHPLYAPTVAEISPSTGILGFTSVLSDDGKHALIEIVALRRAAYAALLADKSVAAFEKGSVSTSTIEAAFVRYKPTFQFSQFDEVPVR